ncbi:hypothetical protein AHiyo1_18980 [Arthrobacter sp. Hiyo1]|nr:hypothetical protein AHiyo1_18980 [Arthrobacter sp. Hiyo1]
MMENHGYDQIIGNTADAPYINTLAQRYNTAANYHGRHAPEPAQLPLSYLGQLPRNLGRLQSGGECHVRP